MSRLAGDLEGLLGRAAFIALTEEFGGTRLYVPLATQPDQRLVEAIGDKAARTLSKSYAPAFIRVPLARELRARHYRAQDLSFAKIAVKLGLTETGVQKLFARMDNPPTKGQGELFG